MVTLVLLMMQAQYIFLNNEAWINSAPHELRPSDQYQVARAPELVQGMSLRVEISGSGLGLVAGLSGIDFGQQLRSIPKVLGV